MITWKMLWRLAPNRATYASALGEAELTCLRDTVVREHHVSLVCVAGAGKPHLGSESVIIDALGRSVQCLVLDIEASACPGAYPLHCILYAKKSVLV
jgi:hypothetical protein